MTNIGDVNRWVEDVARDSYLNVSYPEVALDLIEFLNELPDDLDLGSAAYYLKKEFKRNESGVDDRVSIYTYEPESYSGYDEDGDDLDDDFDDLEDDEEEEFWCALCDDYVTNSTH